VRSHSEPPALGRMGERLRAARGIAGGGAVVPLFGHFKVAMMVDGRATRRCASQPSASKRDSGRCATLASSPAPAALGRSGFDAEGLAAE
jgi:hypothetical protein